jgi:hypothetical protein
MSLRRISLLSGFAALAMLAAGTIGTASAATQHSTTPLHQTSKSVAKSKFGDATAASSNSGLMIVDQFASGRKTRQQIDANSTQDASARARSKGGAAFAEADNSVTKILSQDGGRKQRVNADTTQKANAKAFSKSGPATAISSNDAVVTVDQSR